MISSSGQVVWQARMEAFGEVSVSIHQIDNPLRFPGQYHDVETGLYYNFHRYYAPKLGRYITSDPIGLAGGANTYGYVGGNPIGLIDPLGLQANPLTVLRVTPWQIVLRVLTNPVGDGTLDAWRREHPGEELPTFPSNVDPNAVAQNQGGQPGSTTRVNDPVAKVEYDYYKTVCSDPPPPSGDECQDLRNLQNQTYMCAELRSQWDDKWMPGRHTIEIMKELKRANNFRLLAEECEKKREQCN